MYLSSLDRYVSALGGRLEMTAVFPDGSVTVQRSDMPAARWRPGKGRSASGIGRELTSEPRSSMARARSQVIAVDGELIVERDPQRPSARLLRQGEMDASYVDLADARHLEFDYLRWARLILRAFGAVRVLHVGGAACALPRALLAEDPASRHEVFELDERVVQIAREHLGSAQAARAQASGG